MNDTPNNDISNRLGSEKSPYLLQHCRNPVQWYPWGEEAFEAARRDHKPIFLSIGYSTCYWCHVMERDSFERPEVAEVLNRDYICIKVDREERPDVDEIYMDVVIALNGHGGWPMSVFLTPDRKPFWGGTFFWRPQFLQVLERVTEAWNREPDQLGVSADQITAAISAREPAQGEPGISKEIFDTAAHNLQSAYDARFGGFGSAPKFPPSQQLRFLLRRYKRSDDAQALEMAVHTAECMMRGGLYDHVGGGFARYSTDERWLVPHFEKMLYDNALIAELLVELYQVTGKDHFAEICKETLAFVAREMRSSEGGFLSAIDAGEVGKEGEFYVWKLEELEHVLSADELALARKLFDISATGNFERECNVLAVRSDAGWTDRFDPRAVMLRQKLFKTRLDRKPPHVDDKCLASWNGLMLGSFAKAARAFGDSGMLEIAEQAGAFIESRLMSGGKLCRRYREGAVLPIAFADDYAFVISGMLSLYEATFSERWVILARDLQAQFDELLWDAGRSLYRTSAAPEMIIQKFDLFDGAMPSANSAAYGNLMRLGGFFPEAGFSKRAELMRNAIWGSAVQHPRGFSRFLIELDFALPPMREIAIIVRPEDKFESSELVQFVWREFLPGKVVAATHAGRKSTIPLLHGRDLLSGLGAAYVCRGQQCELPVAARSELERLLAEER